MRKFTIRFSSKDAHVEMVTLNDEQMIMVEGESIEISDGYHTMHELYQHRMALNIALFNAWHELGFMVFKSKFHNDGTMFPGYFIVMANLPIGQISYHYKLKHWDEFNIPIAEKCPPYDGHTSLQVLDILKRQK